MIRLTPPTIRGFAAAGWGAPRAYRNGWHAGMDFPAKKGEPIVSAADGIVSRVKNSDTSFAGKFTVIDHGNGVFTRYLHADRNLKTVGDRVKRGEQIGTVGDTGTKRSAPHVHFDVRMLPDSLSEYIGKFGTPTTGFSDPMGTIGRAVPVEAIMDRVVYMPGLIDQSIARGVKIFKGSTLSIVAIASIAGAGYLLYRYIK